MTQTLIDDARQFFAELERNMNRDWFTAQKPRYDAQLKAPALDLLEYMTPKVETLAGSPVKVKLYRPHRDVRFSKDKTPYNLHLHMLWAPQAPGTQPAYFFGIARDYVTAGAGLMGFDKQQQADWRAFVSGREGDSLQHKIDTALAAGAHLDPPQLKRVPSPYPKDHPRADLLKRKGFTLWRSLDGKADIAATLAEAFTQLNPAMDDLRAFL